MTEIPQGAPLSEMVGNEPIPEGSYHVRCDMSKYMAHPKSDENGSPQLNASFIVFGPEEQEQWVGRKLFANLKLSGQGSWLIKELMTVAGADDDHVMEDTDEILEVEAIAVVTIQAERADPKTKQKYPANNQIKRFLPIE
jgi:hypothetical protein